MPQVRKLVQNGYPTQIYFQSRIGNTKLPKKLLKKDTL